MGALAALRYQPQIERSMARATAPLNDYFRRRADMAQNQIAQNRQLEMQREQLQDRRQYEAAQNLDQVKAQVFQQTGQWPEGDSLEEVFQSVQPEFDRRRQQERLAESAQVIQSAMDNTMSSIEEVLRSANEQQMAQAITGLVESEEGANLLTEEQRQVLREDPSYQNFQRVTGAVADDYIPFMPFRTKGRARDREQALAESLQLYMPEQLGGQFSLALQQIGSRLETLNKQYGNTLSQITDPEALGEALGGLAEPQLGGGRQTQSRADPAPRRGETQPDPSADPIGALVGGSRAQSRETPPPPSQRDREPEPVRAGALEVTRRPRPENAPTFGQTALSAADRLAGSPGRRTRQRERAVRSVGLEELNVPEAPPPNLRLQSGEQFPEPRFSRRLVDPVTGEEFEIPEPRLPAGVNFDFEQAARRPDLSAVPQFGRR